MPFVGGAALFTGNAERLARQARSDEIHESAPRSPVEGVQVVPDRRVAQVAGAHPGLQHSDGVVVALDVADSSAAEPPEGKAEPADAGT